MILVENFGEILNQNINFDEILSSLHFLSNFNPNEKNAFENSNFVPFCPDHLNQNCIIKSNGHN